MFFSASTGFVSRQECFMWPAMHLQSIFQRDVVTNKEAAIKSLLSCQCQYLKHEIKMDMSKDHNELLLPILAAQCNLSMFIDNSMSYSVRYHCIKLTNSAEFEACISPKTSGQDPKKRTCVEKECVWPP